MNKVYLFILYFIDLQVFIKILIMKSLVLKLLLVFSFIAFISVLIMIIIGCTCSFIGLDKSFFECGYCTIGKIVLILGILTFFSFIFFNYKDLFYKGHTKL